MLYTQSQPRKSEKKWASNDMYRKFDTALEATKILDEIYRELRNLHFNKDLRKLYNNCQVLVGELGTAEVRARQLHKPGLTDTPREKLAAAIDYLEKIIIVAKLSQ